MHRQTGLLVACCAAGAAKMIEPPLWIFHPPGQELFDAGWGDVRFVTSVAAIVAVLFLLVGGLLGDIYGRRRLLLGGLAASVLANTCLLFAPSSTWHLLWRALAIVAGSFVLPLALAPLYSFFRGKAQGRAFAWYVLSTTLAVLLASRQGRLAIDLLDWRAAYLAPACVGLVALVLAWRYVPEQAVAGGPHVRAIGHIGWALIVLAILFGLLETAIASTWLAIILAGAFLTFLLGVIAVAWWNAKTAPGELRSSPLRTGEVTALLVTGVIVQLLLMAFYLPTYDLFAIAQGRTSWGSWLALAPLAFGMLASLLLNNRFLRAQRVGRILVAGFVIVTVAMGLMAVYPLTLAYAWQALALLLFGLGIQTTKTVWTNGFFQTLSDDNLGGSYVAVNTAIYSATLQIGGAVGALLGTLLPIRFGYAALHQQLQAQLGQPEQVALASARLLLMIAQRVPHAGDRFGASLLAGYRAAHASGYAMTLLVLSTLALLAALVIVVGVRRSLRFRNHMAKSAMLD